MKTHKIIKVLEFIKRYCIAQGSSCAECFFNKTNGCLFYRNMNTEDAPDEWDIEEIKERLRDIERI